VAPWYFFLRVFQFYPVNIIIPCSSSSTCYSYVIPNRRKDSLGNLPNSNAPSDLGKYWIQKYFHTELKYLYAPHCRPLDVNKAKNIAVSDTTPCNLVADTVTRVSSSSFDTTTLCRFSHSQPGFSKFFCFLPFFFIFRFFKSSMTSSCHRCLGHPTG